MKTTHSCQECSIISLVARILLLHFTMRYESLKKLGVRVKEISLFSHIMSSKEKINWKEGHCHTFSSL